MSATADLVKVTIKLERGSWKLVVLKKPQGAKEPQLAYRDKCDNLGDAVDRLDEWMRARAMS